MDNLKEARPTKLFGVPRVYEKMKEKLEEVESESGLLRKKVIQWARNTALERQKLIQEGSLGFEDKKTWKYWLANKLVLRWV